jgi:hypothetical protein
MPVCSRWQVERNLHSVHQHKTPTIQRSLRHLCAVWLTLHRCVNPFEKPTPFSDRPDSNQFNTALVEHDLHFLTRSQTESFPNDLRDSYVKFW